MGQRVLPAKFPLVLLSFACMFALAQPASAAPPSTDKGKQDVDRGLDLLKHQRYQEAREVFEEAIGKNPLNAHAHFYLGDTCRGIKDWICAEEHYETSIQLGAQSSLVELAKPRLLNAKAWRTLRELESRLNDPNSSLEQIQATHHEMEIAKQPGLGSEQQAIYHQLRNKVDQLVAAQQAKAVLENKMKAIAELRKLEGKWKFVDRPGVFQATVTRNAELEMRIVESTPDLKVAGLRTGDRFLWAVITPAPDLRGYQKSRRDSFGAGATMYATGTRVIGYFVEHTDACDRQQGDILIKVVLAYVASTDTIRVLPLGRVTRFSDCSVREINLNDEQDFYSSNWQEEMKRQPSGEEIR